MRQKPHRQTSDYNKNRVLTQLRRLPERIMVGGNEMWAVGNDGLGDFVLLYLDVKKWNRDGKTDTATAGTYTKRRTSVFFVVVVGMVGCLFHIVLIAIGIV